MINAVKNEGTWPPILKFLDDTGLSAIPLFGHPPVVRSPDGSLVICGTGYRVLVGDWLVMASDRKLHAMTDEEFWTVKTEDVQ